MTTDAERQLLLQIAREAIAASIAGRRRAIEAEGDLARRRGAAFVTIWNGDDLRGCIGDIDSSQRLVSLIARCAAAACAADPRFPPVRAAELPHVRIELSLLGSFERIAAPPDVHIGRHGLLVEQGSCRGLLLPQVAIECRWDAEAFLMHACRKAGLAEDAWRNGVRLWRFDAEVFSEPDHRA
jgi:AmmeMemoRadiSam system protein A